jgi:hypothetical protein
MGAFEKVQHAFVLVDKNQSLKLSPQDSASSRLLNMIFSPCGSGEVIPFSLINVLGNLGHKEPGLCDNCNALCSLRCCENVGEADDHALRSKATAFASGTELKMRWTLCHRYKGTQHLLTQGPPIMIYLATPLSI